VASGWREIYVAVFKRLSRRRPPNRQTSAPLEKLRESAGLSQVLNHEDRNRQLARNRLQHLAKRLDPTERRGDDDDRKRCC
jgi:hypothetical protein